MRIENCQSQEKWPWLESSRERQATGSRLGVTVAIMAAAFVLLLSGCHSSGLPKPATKAYLDEVTAFYVGLAALQVGDDVRADSTLERATQLAQGEPAGWANWGVLALRQGNYDVAAQRLARAQKLAPQNDQIYYLLGVLESKRGNPAQAIVELRRAVQINPRGLRTMYLLAQEVERQGDANSEAEFQQLLEKILAQQPGNPAALLELGRVAAKRGEAETLHSVVARIGALVRDLAGGSATAVDCFAGCGCRAGPSGGGRSHRISAQLVDARPGLPAEPCRNSARCRGPGRALYSFPAAAHANVFSRAG